MDGWMVGWLDQWINGNVADNGVFVLVFEFVPARIGARLAPTATMPTQRGGGEGNAIHDRRKQ